MSRQYLRVFQDFDIEEVKSHLLILGDLSSDCAACQALGIDPSEAAACPQCGTTFRYLTSRRAENFPAERFQIVKRYREKRSDLIFVDYGDYSKAIGQKKARDFFG